MPDDGWITRNVAKNSTPLQQSHLVHATTDERPKIQKNSLTKKKSILPLPSSVPLFVLCSSNCCQNFPGSSYTKKSKFDPKFRVVPLRGTVYVVNRRKMYCVVYQMYIRTKCAKVCVTWNKRI